jgi:hypothetical protein
MSHLCSDCYIKQLLFQLAGNEHTTNIGLFDQYSGTAIEYQ